MNPESLQRSAGFPTCRIADSLVGWGFAGRAGLEACDTAGLETCATLKACARGALVGCAWRGRLFLIALLGLLLAPVLPGRAAIPGAEQLLSQDTLLMVSAPDFTRLRQAWQQTPQGRLWSDPAMKPFRENFISKWEQELVEPLQRELGINIDSFTNLLQGQVTFAVVRDASPGAAQSSDLLLLVDSKDKSEQLKSTLAALRKKWGESGRASTTERIRNVEFTVLSFSTNELPKALQQFLPQPPQFQGGGQVDPGPASGQAAKPASRSRLVLGQVQSLLVVGTSVKAVEPVVAHLTGGSAPALTELACYQANHQAMFRDAPLYGWLNAQMLLGILTRQATQNGGGDAPNVFETFKPAKLLGTLGLGDLTSIACSFKTSNQGSLLQVFLGAPEAKRRGLTRLFAPEPKASAPPPFVPADTVKFVRWRCDGQKAWATLQQMLGDLSPQMLGGVQFLFDSAEAKAKETEPGFDLRKFLIGSLGDDIISYQKAPRDSTPAQRQSPPSLLLLGSPQPENLAAAIKALLVIFPQGDTIAQREFLGHKVFSVPLPNLPMALPGSARPLGQANLSVSSAGGYVAISTDTSLLEEYLRSTDSQAKALRESAGLLDAAQKAGGMGTGWFGYENQLETMRAQFDTWKSHADSPDQAPGANPLTGMLGAHSPVKALQDWMDYSLLPPFDRVSKYFSFSVYAVSADPDGLSYKRFAPMPPALRN